jgi:hypothetical protein
VVGGSWSDGWVVGLGLGIPASLSRVRPQL